MNRSIYYSGEQLRSFDLEWFERDAMAGASQLEVALAGATTTVVSGLAGTQNSVPSLLINIAQGWIAQQAAVDSTSFGSLPADATIIQQLGFAPAQTALLTTTGLSAGQSQWALVEAQFAQVDVVRDGDPTAGLLYYYNSANPTQPLQGPGGNGQVQSTEREATLSIRVVYGTPATTGSEVPPNVDNGWVGLYLIDLTFGQTTIINNQILVAGPSVGSNVPGNYPYAPFLAGLLKAHHSGNAGQAPQIDLTAEVKNTLPLTRMPASDTVGGLPVMKLFAGNPNGNVAGNAAVNGASDFGYDTVNKILYICTVTGTISTALWTAATGQTTSQFAGGAATGTANAQVVASTTPAGFSLTPGFVVTYTAGTPNTTAATLNVDATGVIAVNKNTGSGNVPLTGGELSGFVSVIYTGTVWLLQSATLGQLATMNIGQWLKNDGSGNLTIKNGSGLGDDGSGNFTILTTAVTPGNYTRTKLTVNGQGRITAAASGAYPTRTTLQSAGTGTYTPPAGAVRLAIRMLGAGAGGGGCAGGPQPGSNGTASSFGAITAGPGQGGLATATANGADGGAAGTGGTGSAALRISGARGLAGAPSVGAGLPGIAGAGGNSAFGGGGATRPVNSGSPPGAGTAPGAGGAGGYINGSAGGAGGGGSGEYVELALNGGLAGSYSYTVGAAGVGGTGSGPGAAGADGTIIIDEFYD